MGVVAGGAARCPSSEAETYDCNALGNAQVSTLGSSEASALQRFKCISIMGDSNGGNTTVHSRGDVLSREGLFSEVPLYSAFIFHIFYLSSIISFSTSAGIASLEMVCEPSETPFWTSRIPISSLSCSLTSKTIHTCKGTE